MTGLLIALTITPENLKCTEIRVIQLISVPYSTWGDTVSGRTLQEDLQSQQKIIQIVVEPFIFLKALLLRERLDRSACSQSHS
jgi:Holliday junction resolvasome RuvABC ATP-dependent DNA helicase subunit